MGLLTERLATERPAREPPAGAREPPAGTGTRRRSSRLKSPLHEAKAMRDGVDSGGDAIAVHDV